MKSEGSRLRSSDRMRAKEAAATPVKSLFGESDESEAPTNERYWTSERFSPPVSERVVAMSASTRKPEE